ncbi:Alkanesulfonate monooxygenase [Frankia sp. Hr75.2]|nr:Alkanesulfonate monooxygenase [Frankia sp. Hr75.2]
MPVEFIGLISTTEQSEIRDGGGPLIDHRYVRRFARAHEDADFDRVLIGYSSGSPDGTHVAAYAAAHTERLGFLVAHRPGAASRGERHDRALWTALAAATGAGGNSTALVSTPETVAQALLDYVDIGVSTLLIRGYDPYDDAVDYGRQLIPLVRDEVRRRDLAAAAAGRTESRQPVPATA